jgi:hypothetical protein
MGKIHIPELITPGRLLAAVYLVVVLAIAGLMPDTDRELHATAMRYLGPNTRIADVLLGPPSGLHLEESMRLDRERQTLIGQYVKQAIDAGATVAPPNVRPWPDLSGQDAVPVEFEAEPEWMLLNQGAAVEVWVADKQVAAHAEVLAIVPSGKRWLALLRKSDLPSPTVGTPKDKPVLRIAALPARPGDKGTQDGESSKVNASPPHLTTPKPESMEKDSAKSKVGRKWDSQVGEKSRL